MSSEAAAYSRKVKRAAQMLLFQRHRQPGLRGWELRRALGKDYMKVIDLLKVELDKLGMKVKVISDEAEVEGKLSEEQLDKSRFFVTLDGQLAAADATMSGWRVDNLAVLAAAIAYIVSRQGKAPRSEVENLLKEKLPEWKIGFNLDRFIRMGYISQDENGILHVDWRTRAEVDRKTLLELILAEDAGSSPVRNKEM